MKLKPRLQAIADMVKYKSVADIGTDHGKIPIYLVKNNICDYAVACDINEGPVSACKKNIIKHSLEKKLHTRLCDGLKGIECSECDSAVIAGMGGELIIKIIDESFTVAKSFKELILQPMTGVDKLRSYLAEKGFKSVEEKLVSDNGKIYVVLKAVYSQPYSITFREKMISDEILNSDSELLKPYISKLIKQAKDKLKGIYESEFQKLYKDLIRFLEDKYENI